MFRDFCVDPIESLRDLLRVLIVFVQCFLWVVESVFAGLYEACTCDRVLGLRD